MDFDVRIDPHRRLNPLIGEWVLVSPQRVERPWQGQVEPAVEEMRPIYDPDCYLCPGNARAHGQINPPYNGPLVFTNDFPALLPELPSAGGEGAAPATRPRSPLLRCEAEAGTCRVVCFSPRHDLSLPEMSEAEIEAVIRVWAEQTAELGSRYRWVQVFENKGEMMGCSNPHPHGQIWAGAALPNEAAKEDARQETYFLAHDRPLLLDYVALEIDHGERVVLQDEHWVALVPFWAAWPFEILLLPRRHVLRLPDLNDIERKALARMLKRLLTRYDNLFRVSFPYSMGWHGAPTDYGRYPGWQLHAHFYPPLLRSANVKKFMVGYEMLAEPQRDLTPEEAAERLRDLPERHFRARSPGTAT